MGVCLGTKHFLSPSHYNATAALGLNILEGLTEQVKNKQITRLIKTHNFIKESAYPPRKGEMDKTKNQETRRQFLLSFFDNKPRYEEKQINNYWLIRQRGSDGNWNVAIYTNDNFIRRREFNFNKAMYGNT